LKAADILALFNYFVDSNVLLISSKLNRGRIFIKMTLDEIYEFGAGKYVEVDRLGENTFAGVDKLV
jgi:hypothetical protein